jgi:protein-disulfide isomerase
MLKPRRFGLPRRAGDIRPTWRQLTASAAIAVIGVAALVIIQLLFPPAPLPPRIYHFELRGGATDLALNEVPVLGPSKAPHVVAALVDYTCPHCRALHHSLEQARLKYPRELCIAIVVVPVNIFCNRYMRSAPLPQHKYACELARLSLAVFRAAPESYPMFDQWLFSSSDPPDVAAAHAKAAALVGPRELERAEADPWVAERLARNVEIYGSTGAGPVPVLILPGEMAVRMPEESGWATTFLEQKLGLGKK